MGDSIRTMDVLRDLGFQVDDRVYSDGEPGLSYDFGNFTLSASLGCTKWFVENVLFTGILETPRTLSLIEFEIPAHVESKEQCAAWIVWFLDKRGHRGRFEPAKPVAWLDNGREHTLTLPWEKRRIERERREALYRARPHCLVSRKWMRLLLNTLGEHLAKADDEDRVEIKFIDGVLMFRASGERLIVGAEGNCEGFECAVLVGKMRSLPKRLMNDPVSVGIWDAKLEIDRERYESVVEKRQSSDGVTP